MYEELHLFHLYWSCELQDHFLGVLAKALALPAYCCPGVADSDQILGRMVGVLRGDVENSKLERLGRHYN